MKTTVPNIMNCSGLLPAFKQLPGCGAGTADDLYLFLTTPSPERDIFIEQHTEKYFDVQNGLVTIKCRAK